MSSNLPIGCENNLSAPFNEVEYSVEYIYDPILEPLVYSFYSKPGLEETTIKDIAKEIIENDLEEDIDINDIIVI